MYTLYSILTECFKTLKVEGLQDVNLYKIVKAYFVNKKDKILIIIRMSKMTSNNSATVIEISMNNK